jgi:hypothetical protein
LRSVAVEDSDEVVDHHEHEEEDDNWTDLILVLQIEESVHLEEHEEHVEAAHYQVDEDTAEVHSRVSCVDHPQIHELEHSGQGTHQQELYEDHSTLTVVETLQDLAQTKGTLIRLNHWELGRRATVVHFLKLK